METFTYNGHEFEKFDLLPTGERVNPDAITEGLMQEVAIEFNGEARHLPLFTATGGAMITEQWRAQNESDIDDIASAALNNQGSPRAPHECSFTGPDGDETCINAQRQWWGVDLGPDGRGGVLPGNVVLGGYHGKEPRALIMLPAQLPQRPDGGGIILELEQDDAVGLALALVDTMSADHYDAFTRAVAKLRKPVIEDSPAPAPEHWHSPRSQSAQPQQWPGADPGWA